MAIEPPRDLYQRNLEFQENTHATPFAHRNDGARRRHVAHRLRQGIVATAADAAKKAASEAADKAKEAATKAGEAAKEATKEAATATTDAADKAADATKDAAARAVDAAKEAAAPKK